MNILSIETTSATLSAAIANEEKIFAVFTTNNKKNHSVSLMPVIRDMLEYVGFDAGNIDYVACSSGPGSFTGLRIGSGTAKGIAYSLGIKIIPVPTLDAMAYNAHLFDGTVVPMIDARNNEIFTAFYEFTNGILSRKTEYAAKNIENVLNEIISEKAVFCGDGALIHKDKIKKHKNFFMCENSIIMPNAASVSDLAFKNIDSAVPVNEFNLMYLRKSQAERELERKNI